MNNFAVLNIAYSYRPTAIVIHITTNNRCHLTCYYTHEVPLRHDVVRTDRGISLPWDAYFCFAAYRSVEQIEPGDTYEHTFEVPEWSYCQTKYFCFRGTVAGVLSPSVSPIFKYHMLYQKNRFEYYNTGDDWWFALYGSHYGAESFTPLTPHFITEERLLIYRAGYPGTLRITIRATDLEGHPTGPPLCVATINANTLTTNPAGEWRLIAFDEGSSLLANTKYAIIGAASLGTVSKYVGWRSDKTNPTYTRGEMLSSINHGLTWHAVPGIDMMFEEWGY